MSILGRIAQNVCSLRSINALQIRGMRYEYEFTEAEYNMVFYSIAFSSTSGLLLDVLYHNYAEEGCRKKFYKSAKILCYLTLR
jgi:hypothetical protein